MAKLSPVFSGILKDLKSNAAYDLVKGGGVAVIAIFPALALRIKDAPWWVVLIGTAFIMSALFIALYLVIPKRENITPVASPKTKKGKRFMPPVWVVLVVLAFAFAFIPLPATEAQRATQARPAEKQAKRVNSPNTSGEKSPAVVFNGPVSGNPQVAGTIYNQTIVTNKGEHPPVDLNELERK